MNLTISLRPQRFDRTHLCRTPRREEARDRDDDRRRPSRARPHDDAHVVRRAPEMRPRRRHERKVDNRLWRLVESFIAHVAGDADDAIEWRLGRVRDRLAERVLTRPEVSRQRLAHDDTRRALLGLATRRDASST